MSAKKAKTTIKKKKRKVKVTPRSHAHIQATYNNTIVTITDQNGNSISASSAGKMGFKGPKKATAYAAGIIVRDAVERASALGVKEVDVFVKGVGAGREAAIRAFNANGLDVLTIKDVTPIPHNGCRPPKPRRV
jgi:small subunit ribosomal protein S11